MIKLKQIVYYNFILYFLPAFCFFIGDSYFPWALITGIALEVLYITYNGRKIVPYMIYLYNKTAFKYLILLYCWILITGFIAVFLGYYSLNRFLMAAFIGFAFRCLTVYLYPIIFIRTESAMLKFIDLYYKMLFVIFILGFVEFVGVKYNISFIQTLIHFLSNIRDEANSVIIEANSNMARIRSVFMEPGALAKFIVINFPLIYKLLDPNFYQGKNSVFKNFYKKSIVVMSWICLFLAQSPIYLLMGGIVTILYFGKSILKKLKVLFLFLILIIFFIAILLMGDFDFSKTFLIRIIKVYEILTNFSFDAFILLEPSLAARVINYINEFHVFLKHPIMGIGFGNAGTILIEQFINSPVPLTIELIQKINTNSRTFTSNTFYLLLFQTGIVGAVLYYIFAIKSLLILNKIKVFFYGNMQIFMDGLKKVILITIILSVIYNQGLVDILAFIHLGLCIAFWQIYKNSKEKEIIYKNENKKNL